MTENAPHQQGALPEPSSIEDSSDVSSSTLRNWFYRVPRLLVAFGVVFFFAVFAALHLRNHRAFGSLAYDTAIYDQAVWLLGHTTNPFMTVRGLYVHGHHVNPFLYLLVPISWLGGGAESFLLAQTACFALGAIPVFGISRYLLAGAPIHTAHRKRFTSWLRPTTNSHAEWLAAGIALAYLANPMIQWINWAHFHPESFATLPFLCAWWAMLRRRWGWYGLCIIVLISTREETALAVTMLGLVIVWRAFTLRQGSARLKRERKRAWQAPAHVVHRDVVTTGWTDSRYAYLPGLLTSVVGGSWYLLCTRFILPRYNNGRPPYYLKTFFGSFGGSVGVIIRKFVTDHENIIALATKQDRLDYYWALGRPLGFAFLASPVHLLMIVPSMVSNILTDSPYPRQIEYQYAAVLSGPLWIATIWSLAKLRRHPKILALAVVAMLGTTAYAVSDFSPAPVSKRGEIYWAKPDIRSKALRVALRLIPPNAGVSASDFVLPHLDRRKHAYLWPNPFRERYWGNYDPVAPTPLADSNNVDWFLVDDRFLEPEDGQLVDELTAQGAPFELVFNSNGVKVGRRKPGIVSPLNTNVPRVKGF